MMCIYNKKCNWCNHRKNNVITIKLWCKWYNYNICEDCYDKKLKGFIKYPILQ